MVDPIRTEALSKSYGSNRALQALNLRIRRGGIYGFLGLNGAGKTTAVRILTGIMPPSSGTALINGVDVSKRPREARRWIGAVLDGNILPEPAWSPVRYLRYFGRLHGLSRDQADGRIRELLTGLRLEEYAEQSTRTLSGGNKRKVEIARALLHEPSILFLDEPTRELDIPAKHALWEFLKARTGLDDLTIFLSSHDVQEIATLCTRIGIIATGALVWEGTPGDLIKNGRSLTEALATALQPRAPAPSQVKGARAVFEVVQRAEDEEGRR